MAHVPHINDPARKEWERKNRPTQIEPVKERKEEEEEKEKSRRPYRKHK